MLEIVCSYFYYDTDRHFVTEIFINLILLVKPSIHSPCIQVIILITSLLNLSALKMPPNLSNVFVCTACHIVGWSCKNYIKANLIKNLIKSD